MMVLYHMMNISVIIPTYNRADFILNAIKSVQNQDFKADEIIVIDDGSDDNTKEILKDMDIRYIYQKNRGVSSARNKGIKESKNEWIAFLDSDDTWQRDKLQYHKDLHVKDLLLMASFTDEVWIKNGKIVSLKKHQKKEEPTFTNSLRLCKIGSSSFFCHKNIFRDIGYFDECLSACEDYDLWLRILCKYKIKFIDKKLVNKYAGHKNQLSFDTKWIDIYRVEALKKHIHTSHKKEILKEIVYKLNILLKGARKFQNFKIIEKYEKTLKDMLELNSY